MKYIDEKDGMLYKYKVNIDYDRLKELYLKIEEGNFYYSHDVEYAPLAYNDLDFTSYVDFDDKKISSKNGLSYELVLYSNLFKLVDRLLKCSKTYSQSQDENDAVRTIYELKNYSGEIDLVSLIDKEIEKRKENLYSSLSEYDFKGRLTRLYILKELYDQRETVTSLPIRLYSDVMDTISYEKIAEISLEDYTKYKELCTCDKNTFLLEDENSVNKVKVRFDMDRLTDLFLRMQRDTHYREKSGCITSTELERLLKDFMYGSTNVISLLQYEPDKEEINVYKEECMEQSKNIGTIETLDSRSIDEFIRVAKKAYNDFYYAKENMHASSTYEYHKELLGEFSYDIVSSMDIEAYKKAEEFDEGISEEVMKLSLTKK